jgi:hypothetical protein
MQQRYRYFFTFVILTGAFVIPSAIRATAGQQEERKQEEHQREGNKEGGRVYDRQHKDYHNWDANEDRAYRGYLQDNHRQYRPFTELKSREQTSYWNWRHSHPGQDHEGR